MPKKKRLVNAVNSAIRDTSDLVRFLVRSLELQEGNGISPNEAKARAQTAKTIVDVKRLEVYHAKNGGNARPVPLVPDEDAD